MRAAEGARRAGAGTAAITTGEAELSARCGRPTARHGGGAMGAQVDTPAPTMRNPMSRMYPVSIDPSDGR